MKINALLGIVFASALAVGCSFENTAKLVAPTAPSGTTGASTPTTTPPATSGTASTTPASAFAGSWGSSSIAGLPVGSCADVKWFITEQSATTVAGTLSATCAGGATVSATLNGQMNGANAINLTATGTVVAMGIPCAVNLTGLGTRQANDSMKLDYQGTHCLGNVSGTETLRRFPLN